MLCQQIRLLESQLAQLRSQAAEVEDKRAKLQQRQSAALNALSASSGRKLPVSRAAAGLWTTLACLPTPALGLGQPTAALTAQLPSILAQQTHQGCVYALAPMLAVCTSYAYFVCNNLCSCCTQGLSAQHYNNELAAADKLLAVSAMRQCGGLQGAVRYSACLLHDAQALACSAVTRC